jgi:hypothetical protein
MSRWILTSDWQTAYENLPACIQSHGQEIMLAKKHNAQGVIDLGDLKDSYNPIEARVLEFQVDRWTSITDNGFDGIVLMGNHDRIGQYDDKRNWFGVFQAMGLAAISRPKLIIKDSVIFGCLPYIQNKKKLIKAAETLWLKAKQYGRKKRKVLLFHCDVAGATLDNGFPSQSTVTASSLLFHKWAYCFGGHIHKRQYLTEHSMYVGNPFCCDWGERNQDKGFVLYDDVKNSVEILPSVVPGWYDYEYLQEHKGKRVSPGAKIQVAVTCKLSEDYYAAVSSKQEQVLAKYPNTKVYTKTVFIDDKKQEIPIIESSTDDLSKIKSYVAAKASDNLRQEQTVKYLETILAKTSSAARSSEGFKIDSIKARNVLSFKKLDFSFAKQGIVLIVGVNKDWPKHSNGSGKTNFLSMLPIALEGQTLKKQKSDNWLNENSEGKGYVDLTLHRDKTEYRIYRSRRPTKLKFFVNGRDESESKPQKTQKAIQTHLGFTLDTLKSSIYIDNSLPKAFIEGTQKDRTALISNFQNLERFKVARDLVAKDVRTTEQTIERLQEDEQEAKNLVASTRQEIKAAKQDSKASIADLKRDVVSTKEKVKRMQDKRDKYFEDCEPRLSKLQDKIRTTDAKEVAVAKEIYKVTDELETHKHKTPISFRLCPTCTQRIPRSLRKTMRRNHIAGTKRLRAIFEPLHEKHQDYIKVKMRYTNKLSAIKLNMNELSSAVQQGEHQLTTIYKLYKNYKERAEKESGVLKLLRVKLRKAKNRLRHCHQAIKHELADKEMLIFSLAAFSRDGIPLYLNSLACPLLNKVAEEYSKLFIDGEIQVIFRLNDGELEPLVMNAHGSKSIEGQSAGEMAWAGLITALSLTTALAPRTNLLVLDEPGFGLDGESAKTFGKKLPLLKGKFETILVVTHNDTIASLLHSDRTIVIEKENKISSIRNE